MSSQGHRGNSTYNALQLGDLLVFAMEYVPGEDLARVVKQGGPLPVLNACYYMQQVVLGLQHAFEKGMVHRDIKPHNLILAKRDKKHVVKILDFGLAKARSEGEVEHGLTGAGQMLGTPDYMAPEQWRDAAHADIRADIYSLGYTLYYLLAGHSPFQGNSLLAIWEAHQNRTAQPLNELRAEVPVELAKVVEKMMAKDPAERYQRPVELAAALLPFIKGAGQGKSTGQFSLVAAPVGEGKSQPQATPVVSAEPVRQDTLLEGPATIGEALARPTAPARRGADETTLAQKRWLIAVAGLVVMFLLFVVAGLITFAVLRGIRGGGSEAERKAQEERLREEERRRHKIAKRKEEDEKRQKAIEAERKRREEWEAAQKRIDEERRRQEALKQAAEEKAKREREDKERAEAEKRKQEAAAAELRRKTELEKKGLAFYPKPTTAFEGKDAQQWYDRLLTRPRDEIYRDQTLRALAALSAEGMPFLVMLLQDYQKKKLANPIDKVLRAMKPELIHFNDLHHLVNCLDEECCKDFTRMVALEYLAKRKESKRYIVKVQSLVDDLMKSEKYHDQAKEFVETIARKEEGKP